MPVFVSANREGMSAIPATQEVSNPLKNSAVKSVEIVPSSTLEHLEKEKTTEIPEQINNPLQPKNSSKEEILPMSTDVANYDVLAAAVASAHNAALSVETSETTTAVANEILPRLDVKPQIVEKSTGDEATSSLPEASLLSAQCHDVKTEENKQAQVTLVPKSDTRKLLQCPKCPSTFYSRSGYYRHTKKCGLPLDKAAHLRKMSKLSKNAFKRSAPKFPRPVLQPSVIQEDKNTSRVIYKCPKCPSDFFSKSGFYKHIKRCKAIKLVN